VIPNTVMLIKGGPNPAEGKKLIEYIASREVEGKLARISSAQMPLRGGIEPFGPEFDFAKVRAMKVDWEKVADQLDATNKFVQEAFEK